MQIANCLPHARLGRRHLLLALVAVIVSILLAACGSGSDSAPAPVGGGSTGGGSGGGGPVVVQPPTITQAPTAQSVVAGGSATFTVQATFTEGVSYQWLRNGTAIEGATQASYTLQTTSLADNESQFAVRVSNSSGSTTSAAALLTVTRVLPPVGISFVPTPIDPGNFVVDRDGNFYLIDFESQIEWRLNPPGPPVVDKVYKRLRKFGPDGVALAFGGSNGGVELPIEQGFNWGGAKSTLALGPNGIYVADNYMDSSYLNGARATGGVIRHVDFSGAVTELLRRPPASDDPVAPHDITLSPDGNLYFFNMIGGRVVRMTLTGQLTRLSIIGSVANDIYPFGNPSRSIAIGSDGRVYFTREPGGGSQVFVMNDGFFQELAGQPVLAEGTVDGPADVANLYRARLPVANARNELFVVTDVVGPQNNFASVIRRISASGEVLTVAGDKVDGSVLTTAGPLPGRLDFIRELVMGADGVLYARTDNTDRIVRIRLD